MKKNYIYLTFYQVMAFVLEGEQIQQQNQFFDDEIFSMFANYVCYRTYQTSFIPKNIKNKIPVYKISISLFEYLEKLTSINVFDKKVMKEYKKIIIEKNREFLDRLNNGELDYLFNGYIKKYKLYKK